MKKPLLISIYPKNEHVACLVLKKENQLYRINFLWQYVRLVLELEDACRSAVPGFDFKKCLNLFDRHNRKWVMLLSFAGRSANLVLWFVSGEQGHQQPNFSWHGTVAAFRRAVCGMLKRLR